MLEAIIRGLHLLSVLAVFIGALVVLPGASATLDRQSASQLLRVYSLKIASLLIAAASGMTLWLGIGKPATFYSNNPIFHAKLGVFTLLVLALIVQFIALWRFARRASLPDQLPRWLGYLQKTTLLLLLVLPPLAYLMARGAGYTA